MPIFSAQELVKLAGDVFTACGAPAEEAKIVAEHLVEAELMGLDSHGVMRIPQYVSGIREGMIRPGAELTILNDKGPTATLDCGGNFGQVGGIRAVQLAIERSGQYGLACVVTRHCNHAGRLGAYTCLAAEAGMIALATCNSPVHGHFVTPFGGREGRLATNPFSFAAPSNGDPILLDMSTAAISEGKLRVCLNSGQKVPPGMITDAQGRVSSDPKDFYGPPRGSILPFGGQAGYKGTGLGIMVEILGGTLAGNLVNDPSVKGNGLCFIVISPEYFIGTDKFREMVDELVRYIKSSAPSKGGSVMVPGELDFRNKRRLLADGIELDENIWSDIAAVAKELKVNLP